MALVATHRAYVGAALTKTRKRLPSHFATFGDASYDQDLVMYVQIGAGPSIHHRMELCVLCS